MKNLKEVDLSRSNKNYVSLNPYTGELLNEIPSWTNNQIRVAIDNSKTAYKAWKQVDIAERKLFLEKLSRYLLKNKDYIARTITDEMGKPIAQSRSEVEKTASLCDYYYGKLDIPTKIQLEQGRFGLVQAQAQGGVLGIMPWNFPLWQALRFAVPVLCGGNVVLLKHSQNVGLTALLIEQAIEDSCGIPNVLTSMFIEHEDVKAILAEDHIIGTSVTGSERAGISIGSIAGTNIKKSVMELGGSDPFLVLKDADIAFSASQAVKARLNNNGQTCIAAKRFYLDKVIADEWLELFIKEMKSYAVGSPYHEKNKVSGLAREDLAKNLSYQVQKSVKQGASYLLKGGIDEQISTVYHPEILMNIATNSPLEVEETFGPVASVFVVKDENEMLQKVNNSRFGLGASVWSKDIERALKICGQVEVGSVAINQMMSSDPRLPFGGIKKSGFGREMGAEGYYEFLNLKTIIVPNE